MMHAKMNVIELPETLPILPLKTKILFPFSVARITVSNKQSIAMVEKHILPNKDTRLIGVVPIKEPGESTPKDVESKAQSYSQLHSFGVAATVAQLIENTEGQRPTYTLVVEGRCRFSLKAITSSKPCLEGLVLQTDMLRNVSSAVSSDAELLGFADAFKAKLLDFVAMMQPGERAEDEEEEEDKPEGPRNRPRGGAPMAGRGLRRLKRMLQAAPAHQLADLFAASFEPVLPRPAKLQLLSTTDCKERLRASVELLDQQVQSAAISKDIHKRVEGQLSKSQRDFLLRQQLKAIKEELGEADGRPSGEDDDVAALEKKLQQAGLPEEVEQVVQGDLRKLKRYSEQQPGYASLREQLECIADLPWARTSPPPNRDLSAARQMLDARHYGLDKVKQRIVEYLAVRQLRADSRAPILCFVGPPGTGKTSLAKSVAAVLGRPLQRIALGGVRDEAEIRGHRRTYVGALPGRIVAGLRRARARDAVFVLDEVDKLGQDLRGDPAAALLELLDPEQNDKFIDHYIAVPFDLSAAVFIATANRLSSIPAPLLDRLEVIHVDGYMFEEKKHIALQHLVPRQLAEHGLTAQQLEFSEEVVEHVIGGYTREAGVRDLDRQLAALCRAAAVQVAGRAPPTPAAAPQPPATPSPAGGGTETVDSPASAHTPLPDSDYPEVVTREAPFTVSEEGVVSSSQAAPSAAPALQEAIRPDKQMVDLVLGPVRFERAEVQQRIDTPGVVAGLVWTSVGGEVQYIECSALPGKGGGLLLTGQLGDVIKESAQIAVSWVRANSPRMAALPAGTAASVLQERDLHIHLPAGAIPKDGPSAGVTMATCLVSLLAGRCAPADMAMTGELTLQGRVLPVGGIKEKLIAAHRAGVRRVAVPHRNMPDVLHEVPADVRTSLKIIPVQRIEEVLALCFDLQIDPLPSAKL